VNRIELHLADGTENIIGTEAKSTHEWPLQPNEIIIAVMQGRRSRAHLGDTLSFYTSARRCIVLKGSHSETRHRFIAPQGWEIVGLQFDGSRLSGTHVGKRHKSGAGMVRSISGRTGSAVDQVVMHLEDGTELAYGGDGGDAISVGPYALEQNEHIVIVEQTFRDWVLGVALVFFLNSGRIIRFSGMTAVPARRFMAPEGRQICGLDFSTVRGKACRQLIKVQTCPKDGNVAQRTTHEIGKPLCNEIVLP
jgi:hypothetical protein